MVDAVFQDIRYAVRLLRRSPGFAGVAILSLALGAGASTAIFQLFDAIRLRALPVSAPEQLVELRVDDMTHARGTWMREASLTNPLWEQIRKDQQVFSGVFAWADESLDISPTGQSQKVAGLWVSGDFFRVLGVQPILGRVFKESDDRRGCGQSAGVVISYGFWQRQFGGDPAIVGRPMPVGKYQMAVIGVTPPAFFGMEVGRTFDIAMPICAEPAWHGANTRLDAGNFWWLTVMGRLKRGVSMGQAAALLPVSSRGIFEATLPANYPAASVKPYLAMKLVALPALGGLSHLREQYSRPLALLLAIAGLVLFITCANLAHLMLARANARSREMAVRLAIGASRWRLARQLITESMLLAITGIALGVLVAQMLSRFLVSFLAAGGTAIFVDLSLDYRTLGFAAALSMVTCIVFASAPVLRASKTRPSTALRSGNRSVTAGRDRSGLSRVLLASQVALSLTLLAGTLLFVRSLTNLQTLDAGFQRDGLVIADVNFADLRLAPDQAVAFRRKLLEHVRTTPSVEAATEVLIVPLSGGNWNNRIWMDGSDPEQAQVAYRNMVGTDYFRTVRTTVIAGREFNDQDLTPESSKAAIVNEEFVRQFALGPGVIGQHLWVEATPFEPRTSYEIVGVTKNAKYRDLREDFRPVVFVPLSRAALVRPSGQFVIRTSAQTDVLISSARSSLAGLNPAMHYSFRVFDTLAQESLLRERLMAIVSWPFGVLALILTALGLYGVISYSVTQRTNEIGIRIALGAESRTVLALILREAASIVIVGLLAGAFLAAAAGRATATLLFGLASYDPVSLGIAAVTLALVAAGASYLPARRAASVDPATALRQD